MTAEVAAIHFDGVSVWCATRTSVVSQPSTVALLGGVPTFGAAAVARAESVGAETVSIVDPLHFIDAARIRIGTEECTFGSIVGGVVDHVLGSAGVLRPPSLLIVTHPPHWGTSRRHALHAAVRTLASEVVSIDSASVAVHGVMRDVPARADSAIDFRRRGAVVVDAAPSRVTACGVEISPVTVAECRLVEGLFFDDTVSDHTVSDDTVSDDTAVDDTVSVTSMRAAIDEVRQSISATVAIVHGVGDPAVPARVKAASHLTVIELSGSAMASAALDCVESTREPAAAEAARLPATDPGRSRVASRGSSAAWLSATANDRTNAERGRPPPKSRRSRAALAATFAVVALGVGIWFAGSAPAPAPDDTVTAVVAAADASTAVQPTEPPPTTTAAAPRAGLTLGRTAVTVPDGWTADPSATRVELVPDDASPMRIVIVSRDLEAGSGTPEVIASLRQQFATEQSDAVFGDLRTDATVAGRSGLTYVEEPVDGSTVAWSVAVSSGLQVSVGCQSADGARQQISGPCGVVLDSLTIDGV